MGMAEELKKWRMEMFKKNNATTVPEEKDFACHSSDSVAIIPSNGQFELVSDSDHSDIVQVSPKRSRRCKNGNSSSRLQRKGKSFVKNNLVFVVPQGETRKRKKSLSRNNKDEFLSDNDDDVVLTSSTSRQRNKRLKPLTGEDTRSSTQNGALSDSAKVEIDSDSENNVAVNGMNDHSSGEENSRSVWYQPLLNQTLISHLEPPLLK